MERMAGDNSYILLYLNLVDKAKKLTNPAITTLVKLKLLAARWGVKVVEVKVKYDALCAWQERMQGMK